MDSSIAPGRLRRRPEYFSECYATQESCCLSTSAQAETCRRMLSFLSVSVVFKPPHNLTSVDKRRKPPSFFERIFLHSETCHLQASKGGKACLGSLDLRETVSLTRSMEVTRGHQRSSEVTSRRFRKNGLNMFELRFTVFTKDSLF